jgi:hypothetical protein
MQIEIKTASLRAIIHANSKGKLKLNRCGVAALRDLFFVISLMQIEIKTASLRLCAQLFI